MSEIFAADAKFEPYWWEAAPRPASDGDPIPSKTDVAIVGSGYAGLSAALTLARAGRSVTVLEANAPGEGASSRSGGMVGGGHRQNFTGLAKRYGEETAVALMQEGLNSLAFAKDLIKREKIDCQYQPTGRFRAAWSVGLYDAMAREIDLLRSRIGLDANMISAAEQHSEVATDAYHGGCVYHNHGGLHPGLFHLGLLDRAIEAGAAVAGHAAVTAIEREESGFVVTTARGKVKARNVLVATNGYTGGVTPQFRARLLPVAAYLVATVPLGEARVRELIPGGRMIVETRARQSYYRPSPDGERIIFGARAALREIDTRTSAKTLHRLLVDLFPSLAGVKLSHSWTGFIAFARDNVTHIGVREGLHYALACNGSGVAMAPYAGHKAALKLLGSPEGRTAFDGMEFARMPTFRGRPWFLPALDAYYRLVDRWQGSR